MSGCFGNSAHDRHIESQLNAHLDADDCPALDHVLEQEKAEPVDVDGEVWYERLNGSRFQVSRVPEMEQDPDGAYWGDYELLEERDSGRDVWDELEQLRVLHARAILLGF